jgi:spermidine synthase
MSREVDPHRFFPWLLLLFLGSGCAALIYEIVWLQMLELVIGASGISLGVLLGAFMGGMCLGSSLLPRLLPPHYHSLHLFALLELGIGIIGILALFGIPFITDFYTGLQGHGIFARALIASLCLVPPAMLMGATLPLVSRFVEATPEGVSWMGFFYGANLAGAVIGCLSAGFFLLRLFDIFTATYTAAAINLLVSLTAFVLARRTVASHSPGASAAHRASEGPSSALIYVAIALSGFSALGAEVVWTRLLSLLLGGTVYSFSIILAVFLVGLGFGSAVGSHLARSGADPRRALAASQILLTIGIAWAAFMISRSLPYWPINPAMYTSDLGPWHLFQLDILRTAWVVLPSTLLWGASFPLSIASVAVAGQDPGRIVGGLYASNTIGAIAGSLGFSLFIIPQFGTQIAGRLLILAAAAAAFIALVASVSFQRRGRAETSSPYKLSFSDLVLTTVSLLAVALMVDAVPRIPWMMVAWGRLSATYMAQAAPEIIRESKEQPQGSSPSRWYCTYMDEGMNASVAVTRTAAGTKFFHAAGKVQASSLPQDMRLQRMLGHLSALTCSHPDAVKDILVVACGAGVTAGSFVPYPTVQRIVICDIEPLVPQRVAPMFGPENYHVVDGIAKQNPLSVNGKEVSVIYDDGRHYIRTLPEDVKFDVITSDPVDPWVKGSAALNTVEYYQMCKRHLKPGGIMSLWMPLYESNTAATKSFVSTFFEVFPNGLIFSNDEHFEGYDAVLIGQSDPSPINLDSIQTLLERDEYAAVRESLKEVGFGSHTAHPESPNRDLMIDLFSTFAGQASGLRGWIQNAQINRDRNLRLQYLAGMNINSYIGTKIMQNILSCYTFPQNAFEGSPQLLRIFRAALAEKGRR